MTTALIFAVFGDNVYALTAQEVYRQAGRQVLILEVLDNQGAVASSSTALLLDQGKAVTQCATLEGAANIRLMQGSAVYHAKIEQRDISRNLCILSASRIEFTPTGEFDTRDPLVGSRIYAISNALGLGVSISEGVVSGIRTIRGESSIQFTAAISPGSEGGGLFDADGRLVGLITHSQRQGQNINFAIPARWLKEIEKRATSSETMEAWHAKALTLSHESKWGDLVLHASDWTKKLPDSIEAWLWLAYAESSRKAWSAAEQAYREALKHEPGTVETSIGLAIALLQQQKPQDALDTMRGTLRYAQENARVWLNIAYAESALGHLDQARQAFERVVQLDSWNRDGYLGLASLASSRSDWPTVVAAQRQVARIEPQDAMAWIRLADAYIRANRSDRALSSAERAIEIAQGNGDAWLVRGAALSSLHRHREAVDSLNKGLTNQPILPALGWFWLGNTYYTLKLYPEAIAAYRQASKLEPGNVAFLRELGIALKDGGHFEEALALFEKLKTDHPEDPFPWRQIGFVHGYLAQPESAIPAYEQSLSLDPKQPKVWHALMEVYHMADRRDDVRRSYQKLLALDQTRAEQVYKKLLLPYENTP